MGNNDTDFYPLTMAEEIIIDNDYETVVVNDQEESILDNCENNENIQEIYETDFNNIEHSNNVWCDNSVSYLIHCRDHLKKQLKTFPDLKKKSLWQHVSEHMIKQGFYFDAKACETKWCDLKNVYMYNKSYINADEDNHVNGDDLRENTYDDCDTTVAKCGNIITNGRDNNKICEWTIDSTRKLIQLFGKYRKKFPAVSLREKHSLWEEIAQRFSQLGYNYSANTCHDKWHNLIKQFKQNKQRASKYGPEFVRWIYYKDIKNIIKNSPKEISDLNDIFSLSSNDDEFEEIKKKKKCQFNSNTNIQMPENKIIEINNGEETEEIWTEAATKCLIKLWGIYRQRFLNATQRKTRLLWNEISDKLRKYGHNYSGLECYHKWCLLKTKYLKDKKKDKKLGIIPTKWKYYQDLDKLLGAPIKMFSWSVDSTNCLIDCYDYYKERLIHASKHEKLLIWKQIAKKMSQNCFYYSSKACYNKWLTLKNCYIKNRMRFNRNKKITWAYYNKIDSALRGFNKKKELESNDTNIKDTSNQSCKSNEFDESCYINTNTNSCCFKTDTITELKNMITSKYTKLNEKFEEMENDIRRREELFLDVGQRTLNALDKTNELNAHLLKLLEQLILKLMNSPLSQI